MGKKVLLAVVVSMLFAIPLKAQTSWTDWLPSLITGHGLNDKPLWVENYKTLPLVIEDIQQNTIGLTEEAIQTHTELRIRSAGLSPVKPLTMGHYVYIRVNLIGVAFHVSLDFKREVNWTAPDGQKAGALASVWNNGRVGTHGSSPSYILSTLDLALDEFLNEYLRMNQQSDKLPPR